MYSHRLPRRTESGRFAPVAPYSIRRSSIAQIRANEHGLTQAHYAEVFGVIGADPDWAALQAAEDAGGSISLAVWDDLRLVGYAVGTLAISPHDRRKLCVSTWLYLHPAVRSFGLTRRLMGGLCELAKHEGAEVMLWGAGDGTKFDYFMRAQSDRGRVRLIEHTYEEALT